MWEYKILVLPLSGEGGVDESVRWLNDYGVGGWELVAVVPKIGSTPSLDCLAFLERAKK